MQTEFEFIAYGKTGLIGQGDTELEAVTDLRAQEADDDSIPDFLKIDAETRRQAWRDRAPAPAPKEPERDFSEQLRKHKLRKLRAEERRLSNLIDEIGNRDQAARRKLYDAIKVVEKEIERIEQ